MFASSSVTSETIQPRVQADASDVLCYELRGFYICELRWQLW